MLTCYIFSLKKNYVCHVSQNSVRKSKYYRISRIVLYLRQHSCRSTKNNNVVFSFKFFDFSKARVKFLKKK